MIRMTKKYRFRMAEAIYEPLAVDMGGARPVLGRYKNTDAGIWRTIWHSQDGKCSDQEFDLIEVSPYDHIKKGDRVLVWDDGIEWKAKRYFSHVDEEGRPWAFCEGGDEWSSNGAAARWDHCELWENDDDQK